MYLETGYCPENITIPRQAFELMCYEMVTAADIRSSDDTGFYYDQVKINTQSGPVTVFRGK